LDIMRIKQDIRTHVLRGMTNAPQSPLYSLLAGGNRSDTPL
jgi:hypothetical protein